MKILVTGSNGQLGTEIRKRENNYPGWNFVYADLPDLDITEAAQTEALLLQEKITTIINCAAYTAVDRAESDVDTARKVNATGPGILAKLATKLGLQLIHVSTDFVFNGKGCTPYTEDQQPDPLSVYGRTKLEGEELVLKAAPNSVILRTSWLYSAHGNNFVKTMQRLGNERAELKVIFDQAGTPTWAGDLADAILTILSDPETGKTKRGIYHYSNEGVVSWYDFASEIMDLSGISCKVLPIETKEYPTPAARPSYSVMNKSKIKNGFGLEIPHWKESLKVVIEELARL